MERKNGEQMVYIKDLIFAALRGWRVVLIAAVALAVLLGGIKGLSDMSAGTDKTVLEKARAQYEAEAAVLDQRVASLQASLLSRQAYFENSVLMRLDPYNHYEAVISLYADTGYQIQPGMSYQDTDKTYVVLTAYQAVLQSEGCVQELAQALETEPLYIAELLTAEIDEVSGTLSMVAKCATQAQAEAVRDSLVRQLSGAYAQVEKAVTKHTTRLLDSTAKAYVDSELAESQKKETTALNELLTSLADAETKRAALKAPVAETVSFGTVVKQAVIFAVLGFVAGAFLTVCVIWVAHIAGTKVYSARTLENRTGLKIIGCAKHSEQKNKLDRWLLEREGRNMATAQESVALLATDIRCRAGQAGQLLVTGTGDQADREGLVQALRQAMPNTCVEDRGSLLNTAEALEALTKADAVVLVEQCGVSRYPEVNRLTDIVCDYNKQLVGCVLLDG